MIFSGLACFVAVFSVCNGGSVLFLPPMTSASHKLAMVIWADALADRGHDVYWWAPAAKLDKYQPTKTKNVEHFAVDVDDPSLMTKFRYENDTMMMYLWWRSDWSVPFIETTASFLLTTFCENVVKHHKTSLDRVLSRKYDLIILDELFNPCAYLVTQLLNVPVATYVSTCRLTRMAGKHNGVHVPHSYVPLFGSTMILSDRMSFLERAFSTLGWAIGHAGDFIFFGLATYNLRRPYPELKPVETGLTRPDFQFVCVPKELELTIPLKQNIIHIGGMQIPDKVPELNDEFTQLVNSAKKGFIVVAMGHWANWNYAPASVKRAFIEAFSKISSDYVILWQYNGPPISGLPSHVKLVKWIPQKSLLAHPKCALFITHAGCNSFTEGVYYAVPMLAIPLSADQPDGASKVTALGFGLHIHKLNITTDILYGLMMKIIEDQKYRENVRKFSDRIKSDTMTALDRAIFWTEFAMKHAKNVDQHKASTGSVDVSLIRYYCIDVIVTLILFLALVVFVTFKVLVVLWRFIVVKSNSG